MQHAQGITPFIAHLFSETTTPKAQPTTQKGHFVLVTKITDEKVEYFYDKGNTFLPKEKFLEEFSGYALFTTHNLPPLAQLLLDKESKQILGARYASRLRYYSPLDAIISAGVSSASLFFTMYYPPASLTQAIFQPIVTYGITYIGKQNHWNPYLTAGLAALGSTIAGNLPLGNLSLGKLGKIPLGNTGTWADFAKNVVIDTAKIAAITAIKYYGAKQGWKGFEDLFAAGVGIGLQGGLNAVYNNENFFKGAWYALKDSLNFNPKYLVMQGLRLGGEYLAKKDKKFDERIFSSWGMNLFSGGPKDITWTQAIAEGIGMGLGSYALGRLTKNAKQAMLTDLGAMLGGAIVGAAIIPKVDYCGNETTFWKVFKYDLWQNIKNIIIQTRANALGWGFFNLDQNGLPDYSRGISPIGALGQIDYLVNVQKYGYLQTYMQGVQSSLHYQAVGNIGNIFYDLTGGYKAAYVPGAGVARGRLDRDIIIKDYKIGKDKDPIQLQLQLQLQGAGMKIDYYRSPDFQKLQIPYLPLTKDSRVTLNWGEGGSSYKVEVKPGPDSLSIRTIQQTESLELVRKEPPLPKVSLDKPESSEKWWAEKLRLLPENPSLDKSENLQNPGSIPLPTFEWVRIVDKQVDELVYYFGKNLVVGSTERQSATSNIFSATPTIDTIDRINRINLGGVSEKNVTLLLKLLKEINPSTLPEGKIIKSLSDLNKYGVGNILDKLGRKDIEGYASGMEILELTTYPGWLGLGPTYQVSSETNPNLIASFHRINPLVLNTLIANQNGSPIIINPEGKISADYYLRLFYNDIPGDIPIKNYLASNSYFLSKQGFYFQGKINEGEIEGNFVGVSPENILGNSVGLNDIALLTTYKDSIHLVKAKGSLDLRTGFRGEAFNDGSEYWNQRKLTHTAVSPFGIVTNYRLGELRIDSGREAEVKKGGLYYLGHPDNDINFYLFSIPEKGQSFEIENNYPVVKLGDRFYPKNVTILDRLGPNQEPIFATFDSQEIGSTIPGTDIKIKEKPYLFVSNKSLIPSPGVIAREGYTHYSKVGPEALYIIFKVPITFFSSTPGLSPGESGYRYCPVPLDGKEDPNLPDAMIRYNNGRNEYGAKGGISLTKRITKAQYETFVENVMNIDNFKKFLEIVFPQPLQPQDIANIYNIYKDNPKSFVDSAIQSYLYFLPNGANRKDAFLEIFNKFGILPNWDSEIIGDFSNIEVPQQTEPPKDISFTNTKTEYMGEGRFKGNIGFSLDSPSPRLFDPGAIHTLPSDNYLELPLPSLKNVSFGDGRIEIGIEGALFPTEGTRSRWNNKEFNSLVVWDASLRQKEQHPFNASGIINGEFIFKGKQGWIPDNNAQIQGKIEGKIEGKIVDPNNPENNMKINKIFKIDHNLYSFHVWATDGKLPHHGVFKNLKINNPEIPLLPQEDTTVKKGDTLGKIITYTVKKGDTLGKIIKQEGLKMTPQELAKLNNLSNLNLIYPGQKLRLQVEKESGVKSKEEPSKVTTHTVYRVESDYISANPKCTLEGRPEGLKIIVPLSSREGDPSTYGVILATSPGAKIVQIGTEVKRDNSGKIIEVKNPVWFGNGFWGGAGNINGYEWQNPVIEFTQRGIKIGEGLCWDRIPINDKIEEKNLQIKINNNPIAKFYNNREEGVLRNFFYFDGEKIQLQFKDKDSLKLYYSIKEGRQPNPSDDYLLEGAEGFSKYNGIEKEIFLDKQLTIIGIAGNWALRGFAKGGIVLVEEGKGKGKEPWINKIDVNGGYSVHTKGKGYNIYTSDKFSIPFLLFPSPLSIDEQGRVSLEQLLAPLNLTFAPTNPGASILTEVAGKKVIQKFYLDKKDRVTARYFSPNPGEKLVLINENGKVKVTPITIDLNKLKDKPQWKDLYNKALEAIREGKSTFNFENRRYKINKTELVLDAYRDRDISYKIKIVDGGKSIKFIPYSLRVNNKEIPIDEFKANLYKLLTEAHNQAIKFNNYPEELKLAIKAWNKGGKSGELNKLVKAMHYAKKAIEDINNRLRRGDIEIDPRNGFSFGIGHGLGIGIDIVGMPIGYVINDKIGKWLGIKCSLIGDFRYYKEGVRIHLNNAIRDGNKILATLGIVKGEGVSAYEALPAVVDLVGVLATVAAFSVSENPQSSLAVGMVIRNGVFSLLRNVGIGVSGNLLATNLASYFIQNKPLSFEDNLMVALTSSIPGMFRVMAVSRGASFLRSAAPEVSATLWLTVGHVESIVRTGRPMDFPESVRNILTTYGFMAGGNALSKVISQYGGKLNVIRIALNPTSKVSFVSYPVIGAVVYPAFGEGGYRNPTNYLIGAGAGLGLRGGAGLTVAGAKWLRPQIANNAIYRSIRAGFSAGGGGFNQLPLNEAIGAGFIPKVYDVSYHIGQIGGRYAGVSLLPGLTAGPVVGYSLRGIVTGRWDLDKEAGLYMGSGVALVSLGGLATLRYGSRLTSYLSSRLIPYLSSGRIGFSRGLRGYPLSANEVTLTLKSPSIFKTAYYTGRAFRISALPAIGAGSIYALSSLEIANFSPSWKETALITTPLLIAGGWLAIKSGRLTPYLLGAGKYAFHIGVPLLGVGGLGALGYGIEKRFLNGRIDSLFSREALPYTATILTLGTLTAIRAYRSGKLIPLLASMFRRVHSIDKLPKWIYQKGLSPLGKGFMYTTGLKIPLVFLAGSTAGAYHDSRHWYKVIDSQGNLHTLSPLSELGPAGYLIGMFMNPGRQVFFTGIGEFLNRTGLYKNNLADVVRGLQYMERRQYDTWSEGLEKKIGVFASLFTFAPQLLDTFMQIRSGSLFFSAFGDPIKTFRDILNLGGIIQDLTGGKGYEASWTQVGRIFGSLVGFYLGARGLSRDIIGASNGQRFGYVMGKGIQTAANLHLWNTALALLLPPTIQGVKQRDIQLSEFKKSAYNVAYTPEEIGRSALAGGVIWSLLGAGSTWITNFVNKIREGNGIGMRFLKGEYATIFKTAANTAHKIELGKIITPSLFLETSSLMYYGAKHKYWFGKEEVNELDGRKRTAPSVLGNYIADLSLIIGGIGVGMAIRNFKTAKIGADISRFADKVFGTGKEGAILDKYRRAYGMVGAGIGAGIGIWKESQDGRVEWKNVLISTGLGYLGGRFLRWAVPTLPSFTGNLISLGLITYGIKKAVVDPLVSWFDYWRDSKNYPLDWREASEPHIFDKYTPWRYARDSSGNKIIEGAKYKREIVKERDIISLGKLMGKAPFDVIVIKDGKPIKIKEGEKLPDGKKTFAYTYKGERAVKTTDLKHMLFLGLSVLGVSRFLKASIGAYRKVMLTEQKGVLKASWDTLKTELNRRFGDVKDGGTLLGKAFNNPGLTSLGLIGAGGATVALGRLTGLKDTEIQGVNVGDVLTGIGYGIAGLGTLGLLTRGKGAQASSLSRYIAATGAVITKGLAVDLVGASAVNLALVIAPLHLVVGTTSRLVKESISNSAYTDIERRLINATLGAFYITNEEAYLAQKDLKSGQQVFLHPSALAYLDLGSFSDRKSLYEKTGFLLRYIERGFCIGLSGINEATGKANVGSFAEFKGIAQTEGYLKALLTRGIHPTNMSFAAILTLAAPLARGILPHIKTRNFGYKFRAAIKGLEALAIPVERLGLRSSGLRGWTQNAYRRAINMIWEGTRQEVVDEQITGLAISLLPISPQWQEVLQEIVNEGPKISSKQFKTSEGLVHTIQTHNYCRISDIEFPEATRFVDKAKFNIRESLIGKMGKDLLKKPDLLDMLDKGLPVGTRITLELTGQRKVTFEVGHDWGGGFAVLKEVARINSELKSLDALEKEKRLYSLASELRANPWRLERTIAIERVLAYSLDINDKKAMEMVAQVMADPYHLHRLEIRSPEGGNPLSISTQAFIERRIYDKDFDREVRKAQESLKLYSSASVLSTPLKSGCFYLEPYRGKHKAGEDRWTPKSQRLMPYLHISSVRGNDALVSYLRNREDYDLVKYQNAVKTIEYISKQIATEQAYYNLIDKSGMSWFEKAKFHLLGAMNLGEKEKLRQKLIERIHNDPVLSYKIKELKEKIESFKKALPKSEDKVKDKIKVLNKQLKNLERLSQGRLGFRLGDIYMQDYLQQKTMEILGQGISTDDAIKFAKKEGKRLEIPKNIIDSVEDKLKNIARYDARSVAYILKDILGYKNGDKRGIIADLSERGINFAKGISATPFNGKGTFEIFIPGGLKNTLTNTGTTAQALQSGNGEYYVAFDPFANLDYDVMEINKGGRKEREVIVRPNATGEYNTRHEWTHIVIANAAEKGLLTGKLLEAANRLAEKTGRKVSDLDLSLKEMGDNEILTQYFSGRSIVKVFSKSDYLQKELDNPMVNYLAKVYFMTNPNEVMPDNLFTYFAKVGEDKFLDYVYNFVKGSLRGVRTKEQEDNLKVAEEIVGEATRYTQNLTLKGLNPCTEAQLRKIFVDKVIELGKEKGVNLNVYQRLTSLSTGRNTSIIGYQPKGTGRLVRRGDGILLDAVIEVNGQRYDGSYTWTLGNKETPLQREAHRVLESALDFAQSVIVNRGYFSSRKFVKIETYEELDKLMREYLEGGGFAKYGYWRKIHRLFGDDKNLHAFSIGHYDDRTPLKGLIREGDVISLEPSIYIPGLIGFKKEITMVVPKQRYEDLSQQPKGPPARKDSPGSGKTSSSAIVRSDYLSELPNASSAIKRGILEQRITPANLVKNEASSPIRLSTEEVFRDKNNRLIFSNSFGPGKVIEVKPHYVTVEFFKDRSKITYEADALISARLAGTWLASKYFYDNPLTYRKEIASRFNIKPDEETLRNLSKFVKSAIGTTLVSLNKITLIKRAEDALYEKPSLKLKDFVKEITSLAPQDISKKLTQMGLSWTELRYSGIKRRIADIITQKPYLLKAEPQILIKVLHKEFIARLDYKSKDPRTFKQLLKSVYKLDTIKLPVIQEAIFKDISQRSASPLAKITSSSFVKEDRSASSVSIPRGLIAQRK
ncbi:MAG: M24 family metallopeptidase, partial [Candidatus Omnitrophica bacterium]|nr:M24 family metallopeptidase [Candidatus Omnitrophota bacterium]